MNIIEYEEIYDEDIKDLLVELGKYIEILDEDKLNIVIDEYREKYFEHTIEEVKKYEGKIFLAQHDNKIIGLIIGLINNEEIDNYDFKAPKRGRIIEFIVSKNFRAHGVGSKLISTMEDYFKSVGCKAILIDVFAYNKNSYNYYLKNNYHNRTIEMMKNI